MLDIKEELLNFSIYIVINLLLLGVQTSIWPEFFGTFPAPFFLFYSLIFFALYHPTNWLIGFCAASVVLVTAFTIVPFELLLFSFLITGMIIAQLKKRVFWQGISYYAICCFLSVSIFHICYYIFSWVMEAEEAGLAQIQWGFWFLQSITTVVLSPIMYWGLIRVESATRGFDSSDVEDAL